MSSIICPALLVAISYFESAQVGLPVTVALGAIAVIGYLFGQRTRARQAAALDQRRQQELDRAARIAWQLETIAEGLRRDLLAHHSQVSNFKRSLRQAQNEGNDNAWERLCNQAEAMLGPTMQLAHQLSHAYDQIRQQSDALETFTQGRTDPLTGVGNGRALEQQLQVLLTATARGNLGFAVALVSLDRDSSTPEGRSLTSVLPLLPKLASVIRTCMRDSDFVARYGDDEFVVIMPQTTLVGASIFGDRLRKRVADELQASVCGGLAEALPADEARTLLARADSALYSAKAAGPNRIFIHTGSFIREHQTASAATDTSGGMARQNGARAQSAARDLLADAAPESAAKADEFAAHAAD
jgi:diguanylate cyclase (GGDEF)-like protein